MKTKKLNKCVLAWLMTVMLCMSGMQVGVFADDSGNVTNESQPPEAITLTQPAETSSSVTNTPTDTSGPTNTDPGESGNPTLSGNPPDAAVSDGSNTDGKPAAETEPIVTLNPDTDKKVDTGQKEDSASPEKKPEVPGTSEGQTKTDSTSASPGEPGVSGNPDSIESDDSENEGEQDVQESGGNPPAVTDPKEPEKQEGEGTQNPTTPEGSNDPEIQEPVITPGEGDNVVETTSPGAIEGDQVSTITEPTKPVTPSGSGGSNAITAPKPEVPETPESVTAYINKAAELSANLTKENAESLKAELDAVYDALSDEDKARTDIVAAKANFENALNALKEPEKPELNLEGLTPEEIQLGFENALAQIPSEITSENIAGEAGDKVINTYKYFDALDKSTQMGIVMGVEMSAVNEAEDSDNVNFSDVFTDTVGVYSKLDTDPKDQVAVKFDEEIGVDMNDMANIQNEFNRIATTNITAENILSVSNTLVTAVNYLTTLSSNTLQSLWYKKAGETYGYVADAFFEIEEDIKPTAYQQITDNFGRIDADLAKLGTGEKPALMNLDGKSISNFDELKNAVSIGGEYYLSTKFDITKTLEVNKNFILDLNGFTLNYIGETGSVFVVKKNVNFTLNDSNTSGNGKGIITGGKGTEVSTNKENNGWKSIVKGYGNTAGGAVFVSQSGNFNMQGGTITKNSAHWGGGIAITDGGTFNMTGGNVISNYTIDQKVEFDDNCDDKHMNDSSTIVSKKEKIGSGGGIFISGTGTINPENGNINITDNITNTKTDLGGGGIFVENSGKLNIINAVITNNEVEGLGGGIAGCLHGKISNLSPNNSAVYGNKYTNPNATNRATLDNLVDHNWGPKLPWQVGEVNIANNAQDYFCAGNSLIGSNSLGDGLIKWTGAAITETNVATPYTETTDIISLSKALLGLKVENEKEIADAVKGFREKNGNIVNISGNKSAMHGGGIASNGILTFGIIKPDEENAEYYSGTAFTLKATKKVDTDVEADKNPAGYTFKLYKNSANEENLLATAESKADGTIVFDTLDTSKLFGSELKEFSDEKCTLILKEVVENKKPGMIYDDAQRTIVINVKRTLNKEKLNIGTTKEPKYLTVKTYTDSIIKVTVKDKEISFDNNIIDLTGSNDFTNKMEYGKLTITKKLIANPINNSNKEFKFKVNLYKDAEHTNKVSGTFGGVTFTNGTGEITLTVDENGSAYETINNLPAGIYYTVAEVVDGGKYVTIDSGNTSGNITANATQTVTFTNKEIKGQFTLKKVDSENPNKTLPDAKFTLTKKGDNSNVDPVSTEEDGTYTFENLSLGEYTLTETQPPKGYVFEGNVKPTWTVNVALSDDRNSVNVIITDSNESEVILDKSTNPYNADFQINKLPVNTGTLTVENKPIKGKISVTKKLTFKDKNGDYVEEPEYSDLKYLTDDLYAQDFTFELYEINENGSLSEKPISTVKVKANDAPAYFEVDNSDNIPYNAYGYAVVEDGNENNSTYYKWNGVGFVIDSLNNAEKIESSENSFIIKNYIDNPTIDGNFKVNYTATNSYELVYGKLQVIKTAKLDKELYDYLLANNQFPTLKFTVTGPNGYKNDELIIDKFNFEGLDSATQTVTIKGESNPLENLIPGEYTVTEDTGSAAIPGYACLVNQGDNTVITFVDSSKNIDGESSTKFDFINNYAKNSILIRKSVQGDDAEAFSNETFYFNVIDVETGNVVRSSVAVKGNGTAVVNGLEAGKSYRIVEINGPREGYNWQVEYRSGNNAGLTGYNTVSFSHGGNASVLVTNTYDLITGSLKIEKHVTGLTLDEFNALNDFDKLTFDVIDSNGEKAGEASIEKSAFEAVTNDNGEIYLIGYSAPVEDLKPGDYTVRETNGQIDGYMWTVTGNETAVPVIAENEASVLFTNAYELITGSLKIEKHVTGLTLDEFNTLNDFERLTFDVKDSNGVKVGETYIEKSAFVEATNDNGETYLIGYSAPVEGLRPGNYTVSETNGSIGGYNLTVTGGEVSVTGDNEASALFTNAYAPITGGLVIEKRVTGLTLDQFNALNDFEEFRFIVNDSNGTEVARTSIQKSAFSLSENGEYLVGRSTEINGLKTGSYTVSEDIAGDNRWNVSVNVGGVSANGATGSIDVSEGENPITFTNTYRRTPSGGGDPTPDPTPNNPSTPSTPDEPTSVVDVPDPDTPLAELPEPDVPLANIPEEDTPLSELPEPDVPLANIPDEETPLVELPEHIPLAAMPPEDTVIIDGDVPKTGDMSLTIVWMLMCLLALSGITAACAPYLRRRRK